MKSVPLGDLCDVVAGGTPSRSQTEYFGGDVAWVKIGDMLQGRITSTEESLSREGLASCRAKVLPVGTLLVSIFATIGRTAVLGIPAATNQAIVGVTPRRRQDLDADYLRHYLDFTAVRLNQQARGVAQNNINASMLKAVPVPLPPLAEQKRIAAVLDKADDLRGKRRQALATLNTLLQSVFLDMFGDPVTNPKGWSVKPLVDLIEDGRPITYGILKPGPNTPGGVPYIRVVDIKGGMVLEQNVRRTTVEMDHQFRRSRLRPGDILLSIRGHVGRMAVVPTGLADANITQDTARLSTGPLLEPQYLLGCMLSVSIQRWMAKHVRGVAVQGINIGDIRKIPIPVPPRELQEQYAKAALKVIALRVRATTTIASTEALFATLQSAAFAGTLFTGDHPKTLAEANTWLLQNAAAADTHAKAATMRLIGRESL